MIGFAQGIVASLDFGFGRVKGLIQDLTPEQLEAVPAGFSNSIATLIVHIYSLEARLGFGIPGKEVPADVAAELGLNLVRTQTLPEVKGETAASLLAKMEKSRGLLLEALGQMTEADLDREMQFGPRKAPVRWVLSLLPEHQGQHFGHMQMIKKALA